MVLIFDKNKSKTGRNIVFFGVSFNEGFKIIRTTNIGQCLVRKCYTYMLGQALRYCCILSFSLFSFSWIHALISLYTSDMKIYLWSLCILIVIYRVIRKLRKISRCTVDINYLQDLSMSRFTSLFKIELRESIYLLQGSCYSLACQNILWISRILVKKNINTYL